MSGHGGSNPNIAHRGAARRRHYADALRQVGDRLVGRQQIVGLQFAPEFIGKPFSEMTTVSVEAATDVEICVFPKAEFEWMLQQEPDADDIRGAIVNMGSVLASRPVRGLVGANGSPAGFF